LYFGFRAVFVHLLPSIALLVLNMLLFRALKVSKTFFKCKSERQKLIHSILIQKAQKARRKLLNRMMRTTCVKRNYLTNSTTCMLMIVVTVFVLVEMPMAMATIVNVLVNMESIDIEADSYRQYLQLTMLLANFVITLSVPLNLVIYCCMSSQFLDTFSETFFQKFCNKRAGTRSQSTVGTSATSLRRTSSRTSNRTSSRTSSCTSS